MRIAVHDFGAYPFSAELARRLADRGHNVLYLYPGGFKTPRADVKRMDTLNRLTVTEVSVGAEYRPVAGLARLAQERRYGVELARSIANYGPNVVLSANCPVDAQARVLKAAHEVNAGFVFWMQDVYSAAVRRLLSARVPIGIWLVAKRFERLERRLARESDAVVAIGQSFRITLDRWGVPTERVYIVENWAPLDEVAPGAKDNPWSRRHGLSEVPVVMYAGTLGRKHSAQPLLELATAAPDVAVVIIADGLGIERLRAAAHRPPNLHLLPLQPAAEVSSMLAAADILVALLEPDASDFSIPSKVLTYLAAGRPTIGAMPAANPAAKIIEAARAGIVIDPGERAEFVAAAMRLLADEATRKAMGRQAADYARGAFDSNAKASTFESVLYQAALRAGSRLDHNADSP